jgi:hypothetical protein
LSTDQTAEVKRYFCAYCGKDYNDSSWTIDHIIPAALGGPRRFAITACKSCNNKIGREIEQPALASDSFKDGLGELLISGARIKQRRKGDYIVLKGTALMYKNTLAKFFYDVKGRSRGINMITQPGGLTPEQFAQRKEFHIIMPSEDGEQAKQAQVRLVAKILLGTSQWLWGERFSRSAYATELRYRLQNGIDYDKVLDLPSDKKHIAMKDDVGKEVDALDNTPHATISIFEGKGHLWGLVNILGGFESLVHLGKLDPSIDLSIKRGVVVIAKSTENAVLKMSWDEYERYKEAVSRPSQRGIT